MRINSEALESVVMTGSVAFVHAQLGDAGTLALRAVVKTIRSLYRYIEPASIRQQLVVRHSLGRRRSTDFSRLLDYERLPDLRDGGVIEVLPSGAAYFLDVPTDSSLDDSSGVLQYVYDDGAEYLVANGAIRQLESPYVGAHSVFAVPVFNEVDDALSHYANLYVRTSFCRIFSQAWYDKNRLFLRAGPEETMRRSLEQYLVGALRGDADVNVMPEQMVSESKPVDLMIEFKLSNRVVLIEIKWLGKSKREDGSPGTGHYEGRAREGAEQLVGYLDLLYKRRPSAVRVGYLVVIDGRRAGLSDDTVAVTKAEGFAYEHREIAYDPDYPEIREDFRSARRMFAEPICTD